MLFAVLSVTTLISSGTVDALPDQLNHPIELGEKCKATFRIFLNSPEYYKTFAYVT
jgi:hypothetical protein